ncbi:MAG: sphinganine-1-phosphate aldolase [Myxococcota bacterium]|jgi:sphinganine-1-phosphate aldolase
MERARLGQFGVDGEALLAEMRSMKGGDADFKGGRTWSMVYWPGDAHHHVTEQANNLFLATNGLNPFAFQSLRRMEREVVQMTADLLNGPTTAVGTMTSGGTESILLAVQAYRDRARTRWPWIRHPEIVVPETIHVAFDKAAHYFGVRLRKVAVGPDKRADVRAMRRAIGRNTIAIAASAPQYAHGVVDPIEELGAIALKKRLPFHVDGCFGGFLLPFLERLGHPLPRWDFRVPGVTSISADVHKYGYAPKGASVLVYREMSYLKHQFFVSTDWPGGVYVSPTMQGTRAGGTIAGAWASMRHMGEEGYTALAAEALEASVRLRAGLAAIPEVRMLGAGHSTIVTWTCEGVDTYAVADQLAAKGWSIDRQQKPPSIHCTCNASNGPVVDEYVADVEAAVAVVKANPELAKEGQAAMYGMMAKVPVRRLVSSSVRKVMEQMYAHDAGDGELDELEQDDWMSKLVDRYGPAAIDALDRIRAIGGGR